VGGTPGLHPKISSLPEVDNPQPMFRRRGMLATLTMQIGDSWSLNMPVLDGVLFSNTKKRAY
jgi:hypothetical protein